MSIASKTVTFPLMGHLATVPKETWSTTMVKQLQPPASIARSMLHGDGPNMLTKQSDRCYEWPTCGFRFAVGIPHGSSQGLPSSPPTQCHLVHHRAGVGQDLGPGIPEVVVRELRVHARAGLGSERPFIGAPPKWRWNQPTNRAINQETMEIYVYIYIYVCIYIYG